MSLPPLESTERHEIEIIRDRLFKGGYDLGLRMSQPNAWRAFLVPHGVRGTFSPPSAFGATALEAAKGILQLYEISPDLSSSEPSPEQLENRQDRYFFHERGTIIVRPGRSGAPWVVTWLPNDTSDPDYPGLTFTSTEEGFPTEEGVPGVLQWAVQQSWVKRGDEPGA